MEPFTGIILAGGRSLRMGVDKLWLDAGGRPLIARVAERLAGLAAEIVVVRASPTAELPELPGRVVEDRYPGMGPLAGLHAGLHAASTPWAFAVACDMPFLVSSLIQYLALLRPASDAVVPYLAGRPEPLHAFYHRRCLPEIERCLAQGKRRLLAFYPAVHVRPVSPSEIAVFDPDLRSFININTPEEWATAREMGGWDVTGKDTLPNLFEN